MRCSGAVSGGGGVWWCCDECGVVVVMVCGGAVSGGVLCSCGIVCGIFLHYSPMTCTSRVPLAV